MTATHEHVHTDSGSGMSFLMGMILLLAFLFFVMYYGVPMMRGAFTQPSIQVPGQIDVNVDQK